MTKRPSLRRCVAALFAIALPVLLAAGCRTRQPFRLDPEKGADAFAEQIRRLQEKVRGIDESKIQKALKERTPLRSPVRIAILEMSSAGMDESNKNYARLADILRAIPGGRVRDVAVLDPRLLLGPLNMPDLSLESLRLAAARLDADLLIFVIYDWRVDVSGWPWAFLDLTIAPMFIVPSVSLEIETRVYAYGIDVRNESGIVHFALFAQKGGSSFIPSGWVRGRMSSLRSQISEEVLQQIMERVKDILAGAAAAEPPAPAKAPEPAEPPKPPAEKLPAEGK